MSPITLIQNDVERMRDCIKDLGTIKEELKKTKPSNHLKRKRASNLSELMLHKKAEDIPIPGRMPSETRIQLALRALNIGGDPVEICSLLNWREFENLSVEAFQLNGYQIINGLTFTSNKKRYQIDVLAAKNNTILCIDCKHWMFFHWHSRIREVVKAHLRRIKALADNIELLSNKFSLKTSERIFIVPVIVTLSDPRNNIVEGVPIVSVLKLGDFIYRMPYLPDAGFKYYIARLFRLNEETK